MNATTKTNSDMAADVYYDLSDKVEDGAMTAEQACAVATHYDFGVRVELYNRAARLARKGREFAAILRDWLEADMPELATADELDAMEGTDR